MSKYLFQIWNEKNKNMYNSFSGTIAAKQLSGTYMVYVLYQGNKLNNKVYVCFHICNLMPGTISRTKKKANQIMGWFNHVA